MVTRRTTILGAIWTASMTRAAYAIEPSFSELLMSTISSNPNLLTEGRQEAEAYKINLLLTHERGARPIYPPSNRSISSDAERLIVACEVTDSAYYAKHYERPVWPHGASGITIGIGYDLGYVDRKGFYSEWSELLTLTTMSALQGACGVTGSSAVSYLPALQNGILIPWETAQKQFHATTLPLYVAQTLDHNYLPGAEKIGNDDCLGALVSLVFNRGPSFKLQGPRYQEMRDIRLHVVNGELHKVPADLRAMKRLWKQYPNLQGLVIRRELEARLFEQGLKSGAI